jgi:hypothetical protein
MNAKYELVLLVEINKEKKWVGGAVQFSLIQLQKRDGGGPLTIWPPGALK